MMPQITHKEGQTRRGSATSRDVARIAGVSHSAVSRAFTEGASISAKTREKVLAAADALSYSPNVFARSLNTGRSKLVGVAAGNLENGLFTHALELLSGRLAGLGYQMMVYTPIPGATGREVQLDDFLQYRPHGIFLMALPLTEKQLAICERENIPLVYFNQSAQSGGRSMGIQSESREGARLIARHLVKNGFRRTAFMAGSDEAPVSIMRETAFADELAQLGAPPPLREVGHFRHVGAMEAARRLLARPDRPDAIFCANDQMALATLAVAQGEFGLTVGTDVAIVGFGGAPMTEWSNFSLTTYAVPLASMIDAAVDFLMGTGARKEPRNVTMKGELIVRGSAPDRVS